MVILTLGKSIKSNEQGVGPAGLAVTKFSLEYLLFVHPSCYLPVDSSSQWRASIKNFEENVLEKTYLSAINSIYSWELFVPDIIGLYL